MNLITHFFDASASSVDLVQLELDAFMGQVLHANADLQFSLLKQDPVSVAVVSRAGKFLFCEGLFEDAPIKAGVDMSVVARLIAKPDALVIERFFEDATQTTLFLAYGAPTLGCTWQISPRAKAALAHRDAAFVVLTVRPCSLVKSLSDACAALGLTPSQSRVMTAVVQSASIRKASELVGISYSTAREIVAEALKVSGAKRLPALVDMIVALSSGVFPSNDTSGDFVRAATGLSIRQLRLATAIAQGLTRNEAGKVVGISPAVAKKETDAVHVALDTNTASEIAKRLVEIKTLSYLTCVTQHNMNWVDTGAAPLRFIRRADGSRIAYSDYGPASGKPVFVLHASSTTRPVSSALLSALQQAGYRVLAVDRPGFGLSDIGNGHIGNGHLDDGETCFDRAARDFIYLCDKLKLSRIAVVGRGAAQVVLPIHKFAPNLMTSVCLTNPDPGTNESGLRAGLLGVVKEAFYRRPDIIQSVSQLIITRLTPEKAYDSMQKAFRGSAIDQQTAADPVHFSDYYRSVRPFAAGLLDGYVAEQTAIARWQPPTPLENLKKWSVLIGEHDVLHSPDYVLAYWQKILPDARFSLVQGAGRLLVMSHPQAVVEALASQNNA